MGQIKVRIDKDGDIHMDYKGFRGKECDQAEQKIKKVLAMRLKSVKQFYKMEAMQEEKEYENEKA